MNPSKICVAVRKRPVGADDKDVVITQSPSLVMNEPKIKYDLTPYTERHHFVFDEVFDERVTNRDVYMRCAQPLIETVFNRGNATCFAYGQTGSGKTHTMLGKGDEPGLYACAAFDVLQRAQKQNMEVFASFYEIYGRKLFDLLNERAKLVCREDGDKQINICGLTEHPVARVEELLQIIGAGSNFRAAGATSANSESSRSHAVLQLEVRDRASQRSVGKLSFIDLAGNERASDTFDSDRKTRMEGAEINKSLLALKECIRALGMGKSHVPFRGSILTEVLRDSFLGNSRTTMIATISPAAGNCEHTLNTLRYTSRVKELGGPPKPSGPPPQAGVVGRAAAAAAVAAMGAPPAAVKAGGGGAARAGVAPDQAAAFAAMAERLAMDAAGAGADGASAPSARAPLGGGGVAGAGVAQKPVAKVGRRAPAAAPARPAWNDDFADESPNGPAPLPPRSGRAGGFGGPGVGRVPDAALDPAVASIVQNHIQDLDELETEAGASDIDDGASGGDPLAAAGGAAGGAATRQVRAVHAHIVTRIRDSEEALLQQHRKHVDAKMALMKAEVTHMQRLDERGGIDDYVAKVDALLAKEMSEIKAMREHLSRLQTILREEEVLSQTLTGGNKRRK